MVASKTEQTLDKVWLQENLNIHRIQHDCKNNYTKTEYSIVARKTKQKNKYSMVARKYTVFHMLNGLKYDIFLNQQGHSRTTILTVMGLMWGGEGRGDSSEPVWE